MHKHEGTALTSTELGSYTGCRDVLKLQGISILEF